MPTIPNFPPALLEEHKSWHHARHNVDTSNPPPGYGQEFLRFHRDFIGRAMAWYNQNGNDPRLVEAWASVPEPIRQSRCYNQDAEARVLFQPESFATADELGRFIESSSLHACIHQEAAKVFGDPEINDFDTAPRHTEFYNIHHMVDRWYRNWEGQGRFARGLSFWQGAFAGDGDEVLMHTVFDGKWWLAHPASAAPWMEVGDSSTFGRMDDGRQFRVWDADGDGRLEVLFRHPATGRWNEGKIIDGRLQWQPIVLLPQ
ncbi:hypothetical protein ACFPPD_15785 [Cohnella suwonensis]|uniref:Tyrosinase copper-binding domain-containing protein n=1 Tax=Cohnella suwonensis TaxID=696072 RepID=A0ABW0LZY7_9BACL